LFFDQSLNDGAYETQYAERSKARVVLILFRGDGKGGIQGIVIDCFYID
jgi:hypothetical protein